MAVAPVKKITICGFGLIGGSIALDIQKKRGRRATPAILAFDKKSVLTRLQKDRRFRVETSMKLKDVVDSDIIILAAYHDTNETLLSKLSGIVAEDCLIIDTGAVKRHIGKLADKISFNKGVQFIGSHPMSGKETKGFANAEPGIFSEHAWYLAEEFDLNKKNKTRLDWLLRTVNSFPVYINSALHDEVVSEISHLPQLISTVLGAQVNPKLIELAGPGLRSMLRLCGSPSSVWEEIIDQNRDLVIEALKLYAENLNILLGKVKKKEPLADIFEAANRSYKCLS